MQPLGGFTIPNAGVGGGSPVPAAGVAGILAGSAQETFVFDRLEKSGRYLSDLTPYVRKSSGAVITHDSTAAVHRSLRVRVAGNAPLNTLTDIIRVHYRLLYAPPNGDGGWLDWTVGTFMCVPGTRTVTAHGNELDLNCPDLTQLLTESGFTAPFGLPAGTPLVTAITSIVAGYGGSWPFTFSILDTAARQLVQPIAWEAGVSRLSACNDVLRAYNYVDLWQDEKGVLNSGPIPDYSSAQAAFTFDQTLAIRSYVVEPMVERADPTPGANTFVVIGEDPRRAAFSQVYVNKDPSSPTSTVSLGRPRTKVIRDSSIQTPADAYNRGRVEAAKAARVYAPFTVPTRTWAFSQNLDVYRLVYSSPDDGVVNNLYLEQKWTLTAGDNSRTDHELVRVYPA